MRLGAPVFVKYEDPETWAAAVHAKGYRAAYCPVQLGEASATIQAYRAAAATHDIIIAEVGAWSNPLSPDPAIRQAALEKCKASLALADQIGARCCVNIVGSRGEKWDGPSPDDLTQATFDLIVETVREIIDAVRPRQSYYTLETMPWMYPDSVDSYLSLIEAIDRPRCAAHFDPVNLINSPQRYFRNSDLIRDFVAKLGPYIRSCHVKDIALDKKLTVHLDEVRPGLGELDHVTLLRTVKTLDADLPLMLEHLPNESEYDLAAAHIRTLAQSEGIDL